MRSSPDYLRLFVALDVTSFADACRCAVRAADTAGIPAPVKWAIPAHGRMRKRGLDERLAAIDGGTEPLPSPPSLNLELADGGGASVYAEGERWMVELDVITASADARGVCDAMIAVVAAMRALAGAGGVRSAVASWRAHRDRRDRGRGGTH